MNCQFAHCPGSDQQEAPSRQRKHSAYRLLLLLPELLTGASAKSRPFEQNSGNFRFLGCFMHISGVFRVPNLFTTLSRCFLNTFVRSGGTEATIRHHFESKSHRTQPNPPLTAQCNCIRRMMKIRKICGKTIFGQFLFRIYRSCMVVLSSETTFSERFRSVL